MTFSSVQQIHAHIPELNQAVRFKYTFSSWKSEFKPSVTPRQTSYQPAPQGSNMKYILVYVFNSHLEFSPEAMHALQSLRVHLQWNDLEWQLVPSSTGTSFQQSPRAGWGRIPLPHEARLTLEPGLHQGLLHHQIIDIIGKLPIYDHELQFFGNPNFPRYHNSEMILDDIYGYNGFYLGKSK
jgi:hypothetical protein